MRTTFLFLLLSIFMSGCISNTVEVNTINKWERHYFSVEEFREGTKDISLKNDETIWVLSNKTLYHILKTNKINGNN